MSRDWTLLTDDAQLLLAHEALSRAAELIATQAEFLATEMDGGGLSDRGGADALRLLAAIIRLNGGRSEDAVAGRA
jgi:hypothetical protein